MLYLRDPAGRLLRFSAFAQKENGRLYACAQTEYRILPGYIQIGGEDDGKEFIVWGLGFDVGVNYPLQIHVFDQKILHWLIF